MIAVGSDAVTPRSAAAPVVTASAWTMARLTAARSPIASAATAAPSVPAAAPSTAIVAVRTVSATRMSPLVAPSATSDASARRRSDAPRNEGGSNRLVQGQGGTTSARSSIIDPPRLHHFA